MTPAGHLAEAARLLGTQDQILDNEFSVADMITTVHALTHAVIAVAIELGVPHQAAPQGGDQHAAAGT